MVDQVLTTQINEEDKEQSYDTSDPVQVNTARKKAARTRADRLKFVQAAMQHPQGRSWFFDIINRCHVFNNPFVRDSDTSTAFKCGELNIGLMILADIQDAAPDQYLPMILENKG
jgi:hypothetical protein